MKKPYNAPQLFRVDLNQEQATLNACSLMTTSASNGGSSRAIGPSLQAILLCLRGPEPTPLVGGAYSLRKALLARAWIEREATNDTMAKILVIDDDRGIRGLLDAVLRQKGYDMVLADGGRMGLELFRKESPDVIVLDLKMPEMDGLAVLQEIRRIDLNQPVIIFTGAGTPEMEQPLRALGVTEFVEKAGSLHRLEEALARALTNPDPAPVNHEGEVET